MDLLTSATTFATLISLISDFRDKRKEVAVDDYEQFLQSLTQSRHEELKTLIEQNQATVIAVKAILNENSVTILNKLVSIDSKLALLLSEDVIFSDLVRGIRPDLQFSDQAISILRQFEDSNASKLLEVVALNETAYLFMDGTSEELECSDLRFIEDDFARLAEERFLRLEFNSQEQKLYIYTRKAKDFLKSYS